MLANVHSEAVRPVPQLTPTGRIVSPPRDQTTKPAPPGHPRRGLALEHPHGHGLRGTGERDRLGLEGEKILHDVPECVG